MDEGCLPAEVVDALLAGHLDGEAARRAHAHVDTCGDCRVLVGQLAKDALGKDETLASNETLATGETALENTRPREHRVMAMPARIDRYSIVKRLGAGGMGIVYLADDDELKRKVVIKLLRTETLEGSAADRARLLREAQAMAKVSHPNVVPIYDVGVYEERVFLAMEYIDGQDLSGWLAEPRAPRDVLAIFVAAGRGLAAAHRAGLVHRDFKPHNVMLAKTGEVKVTDFGLARAEVMEDAARSLRLDRTKPRVRAGAASLLDSPLTLTGALIGTPAYMAPEQILVEPIDGRTDQFSFCVALYEALYRERPFTGNTVDELFEQTLEKRPVFKAIRGVSARVRAAMKRGLSVEPDDRFPTMEALLAEIEPRAKKPYLVAGVLATVALGAAGVAIAMQRTGRAVCTGGEAELASVWSADRESALEAAFVRADAKFGPTAFRAVKPALERYAKAWIANHGDACNDTVREEQSEAAMDRRMACLRKRRYELDATLEVLGGKPDPSLLVNAAAIVDQLASPDVCANTSALAPEVTDPKLRAAVDEIQKGLAKTSALAAAARIDEASAIMKDVAARAEQLGQSVLLADVYFSLGELAEARLDWPAAQAFFDKTVERAETGGSDAVRAKAYIHLVGIARAVGRLDDADRWARYASATIERLGDRTLLAWLDRMIAETQRARGQNELAAKTYQRALDRMIAQSGQASRNVAVIQQELAMHYTGYRDYEAAYAMFEKARETYTAAAGTDTNPDSASVVAQLAQIRYQQGRFDEALALGEQEMATMKTYFGEGHPLVIAGYPIHALRLQGVGKNAEAVALMTKAVDLARETHGVESPHFGSTVSTLAVLQLNLGKLDEAAVSFEQGIAAFTKGYKTEEHVDVVTDLNALGVVRARQKRYDDALAIYARSRAILTKIQGPDSSLMADTVTRIGSTHLEAGKPASAVAALEEALAMRLAGKAGPAELSWTKLELAKALALTGNKPRAIALATEARADADAAGDTAQSTDAASWLAAQ